MLTTLPSSSHLLSEMRRNLTYEASVLPWGSSAECPVCCIRSSPLAFPAAFRCPETASKYFLLGGIIQIDCSVDAPALKPKSQTYLPVSKTFKLCFQITRTDVFFLCKQNILIPSISGRGKCDQNRICVWRIMSFICTLVYSEEINAGISLLIMNQNINCYCFVLFSWEHTLLGFWKWVIWVWLFFLAWC